VVILAFHIGLAFAVLVVLAYYFAEHALKQNPKILIAK